MCIWPGNPRERCSVHTHRQRERERKMKEKRKRANIQKTAQHHVCLTSCNSTRNMNSLPRIMMSKRANSSVTGEDLCFPSGSLCSNKAIHPLHRSIQRSSGNWLDCRETSARSALYPGTTYVCVWSKGWVCMLCRCTYSHVAL